MIENNKLHISMFDLMSSRWGNPTHNGSSMFFQADQFKEIDEDPNILKDTALAILTVAECP